MCSDFIVSYGFDHSLSGSANNKLRGVPVIYTNVVTCLKGNRAGARAGGNLIKLFFSVNYVNLNF